MTDKAYLRDLRTASEEEPLRILTSACLLGALCGVDGSSNGSYPNMISLSKYRTAKFISFCPEDFAFGSPRETPDIEGGTGHDVLNGKARVISESGKDMTEGMIEGAKKMLEVALAEKVELAIMMDVSGACGSQVIYKGHRFSDQPKYQIGMGVCAALLEKNGIKIISQRDYRSLEILISKLDPQHNIDPDAIDHDETFWYKEYFKK